MDIPPPPTKTKTNNNHTVVEKQNQNRMTKQHSISNFRKQWSTPFPSRTSTTEHHLSPDLHDQTIYTLIIYGRPIRKLYKYKLTKYDRSYK